MLQRRSDPTKWVWCFIALSSGPVWTPVGSVTVRTPANIPATIESQAKFFQDFFSVQLSPYKIEFGHVCEDPNTWEQRYEKKDFKNHRDMGKVRWGDKQGGYGEHYWDLNHAGHAGDLGSDDYDDGSYHENPKDDYKETDDQSNKYETAEYIPDEHSNYDDNGRAKRAHSKVKSQKQERSNEEKSLKPKRARKNTDQSRYKENEDKDIGLKQTLNKNKKQRHVREERDAEVLEPRDKKHIVLVLNQKAKRNYVDRAKVPKQNTFVPYENEAVVKQHLGHDTVTSASLARLVLDPSTGHIVDRVTGQAYVLQPVPLSKRN